MGTTEGAHHQQRIITSKRHTEQPKLLFSDHSYTFRAQCGRSSPGQTVCSSQHVDMTRNLLSNHSSFRVVITQDGVPEQLLNAQPRITSRHYNSLFAGNIALSKSNNRSLRQPARVWNCSIKPLKNKNRKKSFIITKNIHVSITKKDQQNYIWNCCFKLIRRIELRGLQVTEDT
jgi:hypothetical protein